MRVRDFDCSPLSSQSLGEALRPLEPTARAILEEGPDAIDRIHCGEALERLIDQAGALAEDLTGETRLRCLMSVRCLLDTQESYEGEA